MEIIISAAFGLCIIAGALVYRAVIKRASQLPSLASFSPVMLMM